MKTVLYPLKLSLACITFGIVLFTVSELISEEGMFPFPWMQMFSVIIVLGSFIIFGVQSIRFHGLAKKRLLLPIIGTVILLGTSWLSFVGHQGIVGLLELGVPSERMLEAINSESIPMEKRAMLSEMYASQYYIEYQKVIKYYTLDGSMKLYVPTSDDAELIRQIKQMVKLKDSVLVYAYLCLASGVFGLLAMFLILMKHKGSKGLP